VKVDLQDKPADFVEKYREANPNPSSSAKVPILQVGETVLVESMVITEYIADHFGEQGNAGFLPPTAEGRAKARLMVELSPFGSTFGILAKRNEPEALKTELSELRAQLHSFNDFLNVHASAASPFLLDEFCTAEAMLAPFLQRFCTLLPHYCGDEADVRLWCKEDGLEKLGAWIEAVTARPSVVETGVGSEAMIESIQKFLRMMDEKTGPWAPKT